jgi:hypothetical protein
MEMSIRYESVKSEPRTERDGSYTRVLKELKLFEVSLTPIAMNPKAKVTSVKDAQVAELKARIDQLEAQVSELLSGTATPTAEQKSAPPVAEQTATPQGHVEATQPGQVLDFSSLLASQRNALTRRP